MSFPLPYSKLNSTRLNPDIIMHGTVRRRRTRRFSCKNQIVHKLHKRWRKALQSRSTGTGFKQPWGALVKSQGTERHGKRRNIMRHV